MWGTSRGSAVLRGGLHAAPAASNALCHFYLAAECAFSNWRQQGCSRADSKMEVRGRSGRAARAAAQAAKHVRRVATPYDKLPADFLAMLDFGSMRLWLRGQPTTQLAVSLRWAEAAVRTMILSNKPEAIWPPSQAFRCGSACVPNQTGSVAANWRTKGMMAASANPRSDPQS